MSHIKGAWELLTQTCCRPSTSYVFTNKKDGDLTFADERVVAEEHIDCTHMPELLREFTIKPLQADDIPWVSYDGYGSEVLRGSCNNLETFNVDQVNGDNEELQRTVYVQSLERNIELSMTGCWHLFDVGKLGIQMTICRISVVVVGSGSG